MVGLPQDCHHLPLHKFATVVARRAVETLEVHGAQAVPVPHEETAVSQVTATHCTQTHTHTDKYTTAKKNEGSSTKTFAEFIPK